MSQSHYGLCLWPWGTNPEAQRAPPAHWGVEVSKLLPHPAHPPSLITDLEKKPGSYRDHGPNEVSSQLWQGTVQCSCCFISSHGGRPKVTLSNARAQEHRHSEFCTMWGHLDLWNLSFLDDSQIPEDFNEEHQIPSCGIRALHGHTTDYQPLGSALGFLVSYGSNPWRPFSCLLQAFLHDVPDS